MGDESQQPSFEELLAWSMDAEPALLRYLPELFADLEELGAWSTEVLQILQKAALPEDARVLDLGSGKGAVALALAQRGWRVHGVDGMSEFVAHASARAAAAGVSDRCTFAVGDVRDAVTVERGYDLVCMLALGDVLGHLGETVAALRQCVRPGGYVLIDDAYLRDGATLPEDAVHCFDHETTMQLLRSCGDTVVAELVIDGPDSRPRYDAMTNAIATRAAALAATHPEDAALLHAYVERQQTEVDILCGPITGALWLLQT